MPSAWWHQVRALSPSISVTLAKMRQTKTTQVGHAVGVEPQIGGYLTPKMDGLFHGSNPIKMHDLGGFTPLFLETPK